MGVYEALGVKPIINATGTFTRLGGSLMPTEVVEAMAQASRQFVCLEELQYRAGQAIAHMVGAEAAYVVSGAYAGVVLSIAACITRLDPARMDRLPNTAGLRREIVMARVQRNSYDHAVELPGGVIVEAGRADACTADELAAAITDQTAAIFFMPDWGGPVTLADAVRVGRRHDVPVVVDASGRLDEPHRLRDYVATGPDLIAFSGGKHIRGPQASGFVCGRRDLIAAIAWQHLDMDFSPDVSVAPQELLPMDQMPFVPRQGIGRGYKAGKEEIVGLVTALRLFLNRDWAAERAVWDARLHHIVAGLADVPGVRAEYLSRGDFHTGLPFARVAIDPAIVGMTGNDFILALKRGDPPIHPSERELARHAILINPFSLVDGDEERIVRRIREIILAGRRSGVSGGLAQTR